MSFLASAGGGAIIGGAISALGGLLAGKKAGDDAAKATAAQIAWERERATHAHQWEMQDLKEAGLNPILAAGGSGAVTGGISAPMPDRSGYTSAGQAIADAVNNYVENKRKQAETTLLGEQTANTRQDTLNKFAQNGLIKIEQDMMKAKLGLIPIEKAKLEAEKTIKQIEAEYGKASKISEIARNYGSAIGSVIGAGGISAMAISKIGKMKNKVGGKPFQTGYEGYTQGPWEGSYLAH